jgi:hypothetical protein
MTDKPFVVIVGYDEDSDPVALEIKSQEDWEAWLASNGINPDGDDKEMTHD